VPFGKKGTEAASIRHGGRGIIDSGRCVSPVHRKKIDRNQLAECYALNGPEMCENVCEVREGGELQPVTHSGELSDDEGRVLCNEVKQGSLTRS